MVESTGTHHHFVFPSGKHSDRFLRVANVLLYSSEITFIAHALLNRFDSNRYKAIYCDTSSINSVALALNDLVNRFRTYDNQKIYPIVSFKSYEGLYNKAINLKPNHFIIISASTSGGMLDYFLKTHQELRKENLIILYFLQNRTPSPSTLEQVICNLTKSSENIDGIDTFETKTPNDCPHCENNSFAVEVSGDVFLLEKPRVNSLRINAEDIDRVNLSPFVNQFMSIKGRSSILKVNYKETGDDPDKKYEIYIDYSHIIDSFSDSRLSKYKAKLDAYINQYVPSNLEYLLHLNDQASKKLAEYIATKIGGNQINKPKIINQLEFGNIEKNIEGSILIVGSCISNGKNLLYLSRALRDYNLRIVYFIGINRSCTQEAYSFLKTNLKYGKYGSENSTLVEVEKILCSNLSVANAWQIELEFLKKHIAEVDDIDVRKFLNERKNNIEAGYGSEVRGMSENIFLPRIFKRTKREALKIRRNSAFFDRDDYAKNVSQSDVYFVIGYVLNKLRSANSGHTLKQSMFVRNIIAPENLNRFNDGIIQASILRNAKRDELNYSISEELSYQVREILVTIFKYYEQEQGEAMLEFLYALSIKKMQLKKKDLQALLYETKNISNKLVKFYAGIIQKNLELQAY